MAVDTLKEKLTSAPILRFADRCKVRSGVRSYSVPAARGHETCYLLWSKETENNYINYSSLKLELRALKWTISKKVLWLFVGVQVYSEN